MGPNEDNEEFAKKQLEEEIKKSLGHELIDKTTLRHIAYYKALSEGLPSEIIEKIRNGQIFEDELMQILAGEFSVHDIEHFDCKIKSKCAKCHQEVSDSGSNWNSQDGMTDSVMSTEDDKFRMMLIKGGNYRNSEEPNKPKTDAFSGESNTPGFH
jgi:hypothetical protein